MKILYIAGESANWVINLCNEMCNLGHEVTCVVQQLDEYDKDNPVLEHKNLTRINVDYSTMFNPMLLEIKLQSKQVIGNGIKYDIIYGSHAPVSPVIKYLGERYKTPWGIMLLDIPTDLIRQQRNRALQWQHWLEQMKYANSITFNTFVARDEYYNFTKQYFPDENVITYAVKVPDKFINSGIDIKGYKVISAFRLTAIKNASMITKALARLDKPITQVVIGRDNGDLSNIIKIAKENNILVECFNGVVTEEQKYEEIKNSCCLIYPQLSEYIGGLSPWEGMILGKPVIVSDYKVLRDLFKEHVIYFNPNSVTDLAEKIAYVNSRKMNAERYNQLMIASDYALKEASFENMASKLIKIFERMKVGL